MTHERAEIEVIVSRLKRQGLTNKDIIQLFKESGKEGLEVLAE